LTIIDATNFPAPTPVQSDLKACIPIVLWTLQLEEQG